MSPRICKDQQLVGRWSCWSFGRTVLIYIEHLFIGGRLPLVLIKRFYIILGSSTKGNWHVITNDDDVCVNSFFVCTYLSTTVFDMEMSLWWFWYVLLSSCSLCIFCWCSNFFIYWYAACGCFTASFSGGATVPLMQCPHYQLAASWYSFCRPRKDDRLSRPTWC